MSGAPSFTAEQRAAVEDRHGPFALAAAAGSGKTSVLVERYVRAVADDGVEPSRILAITFTDRAAGELRERVRRRLIEEGCRDAARESAAAHVSTFHGFCARLLRAHAALAGLPAAFGVLGDAQGATLRDRAFDEALAHWLEDEGPAALELAADLGVDGVQAAIVASYDELRSRGERAPRLPRAAPRHDPALARARLAAAAAALGPQLEGAAADAVGECARIVAAGELPPPARVAALALPRRGAGNGNSGAVEYEQARAEFEQACADALGVPAVTLLGRLLERFADRYRLRKHERGALDFDDLELEAAALLGANDELRAHWSARFELVMVDELQDTNGRQLALLGELDRGNLFTVGDELQAIYGFRHADVARFRARHAELDAAGRAGALATNFRSRPELLTAVNAIFAQRFGGRFLALRAGRAASPPAPEPPLELLLVDNEGWEADEERLGAELAPAPLWRRAEARLLAARLDQLIRDGRARPEEIVVLLRSATAMRVYETALADLGHATLATAAGGFFERPEVLDLVAYVRALANPLDEEALFGVLASPLCGSDAGALAALALRARERGAPAWAALAAEPWARGFVERFAAARARAVALPLADVLAEAVAGHGYDLHLAGLHNPERRLANVHKLEQLARDFEEREGRDLRAFARALGAGRVGSLREDEVPPPAAGTGAIRLMTIHAAKGLEFPVVCVADLAHAPRHDAPRLLCAEGRVGLRLPTAQRDHLDTLAYAQLRAERRRAAAEEEERIVYVALTRARERLILSGAARFAHWPSDGATPITWLAPALVPEIADRARAGGGVEVLEGAGGAPVRVTLCGPDRAGELLGGPRAAAVAAEQLALPLALAPSAPSAAPVAERGQPAGGPLELSYTSLAEYERCGYRYHLQRVLGLPDTDGPRTATGPALAGAARGIVIHALLETLDFAQPLVDVGLARAIASREGLDEDPQRIADLAGAFARSPLCARLAAAGEVRREQPFAFLVGNRDGPLVRGVLDVAAAEADGSLLVVDYKSDEVGEDDDLAARVERDYGLQRTVYALAGLASGAPAVEVAHCFLRRPETSFAARFEAGERSRLEALLSVRIAPLAAETFEVSADPGRVRCGTCPGRARLCSWEADMTLRERPATEVEPER